MEPEGFWSERNLHLSASLRDRKLLPKVSGRMFFLHNQH